MDTNKIGRFIFSIESFHQNPGLMLALFQNMNVLNVKMVEINGGRPALRYKAIHPEFRELEVGEYIPYYKISINVSGICIEEIPSPPLDE